MRLDDFTIPLSGTLLDAVEVMEHNHSRCAVVMDTDKVVGVISEGDVMRALLRSADIRAPIKSFMNVGFRYLEGKDHDKALELIRRHGISLVPIVDSELHLVDVITLIDILGAVRLS